MKAHKMFIGILWMILAFIFLAGCSTTNPLDELTEWDLVYICDSSGWGVAEKLAENIKKDTGKTVRVHDYAVGELSALKVLNALQADPASLADLKFKTLQGDVAEAEVIVFFANPRGDPSKGGIRGGMEKCIGSVEGQPPEGCTLELYAPYVENLRSIYERMLELRQGKPTILRAVDFYNPVISRHRKINLEHECTECFETFNTAVRQAAEPYNIPLVSVYDAFNGIEHTEDPREAGYIGKDGIHTSELGQQVIADLLSGSGYEPIER